MRQSTAEGCRSAAGASQRVMSQGSRGTARWMGLEDWERLGEAMNTMDMHTESIYSLYHSLSFAQDDSESITAQRHRL